MKIAIAFCTLRDICDSKLRVLSRNPPRYLTLSLSSMRSGPTLSGSCTALLSCCPNQNNIHSVLLEFSLSLILSIQLLIPLNVSSSNCIVVVSCCLSPALNDLIGNSHLQIHLYLPILVPPCR